MFSKPVGFTFLATAALAGCTTVQKDGITHKPDRFLATGAGKTIQLDTFRHIKRDCTPRELPTVRVVSRSGGGAVKQSRSVEITSQTAFKGEYAHCNGMKVPGTAVTYTPRPGFVGVDQLTLEIYFVDGLAWRQNITVNVR